MTRRGRWRSTGCLFCRIAAGEIPATLIHQDDLVIAVPGHRAPRADAHPGGAARAHRVGGGALTDADAPTVGRLFAVAAQVARDAGIAEAGYRLVTNVGRAAGQTVEHLHIHLLGGRSMAWPPG